MNLAAVTVLMNGSVMDAVVDMKQTKAGCTMSMNEFTLNLVVW